MTGPARPSVLSGAARDCDFAAGAARRRAPVEAAEVRKPRRVGGVCSAMTETLCCGAVAVNHLEALE